MKLHRIIILSLLLLVFTTAQSKENKLQYSMPQLWYQNNNKVGNKNVDVFYILPTCVWDRVNDKADTLYYADVNSKTDRDAMLPSLELAKQIFGQEANFYSPYYRQLALQSWRSELLIAERFPYAFADIQNAFNYYIKNINNGRPFILAGFSQGAKCVVELLKRLSPKQYKKLVAAYVIGYKVSASDTTNYKQIKAAKSNNDIGVTICYNSVSSPDAICKELSPSALCINPLNWTSSSQKAQLNDTVKVSVNNNYNVLIVDGFNPNNYYIKSLDFIFKKGNYHLQELSFYKKNISENVILRFKSFGYNKK